MDFSFKTWLNIAQVEYILINPKEKVSKKDVQVEVVNQKKHHFSFITWLNTLHKFEAF
jgi:hypothetical protein